jgi:GNAT superfamily N-acetyltransferase
VSDEIRITRGYAPGAIGWVVELHGLFYGREWGFGPQFEAEVACELGEFFGRYNPARDGFWLACRGEKIIASLTLDHALAKGESSARVRWFIAAPEAQGTGVGSRLFEEMLAFAQNSGHDSLHLWTFDGLTAARRIYDRAGFVLTDEEQSTNWGPTITAQRMQR